MLEWPLRPGVRVDAGIREGTEVLPFYDPLLAKLIAWGQDREEARRRLAAALRETTLLGVSTNQAFLLDILESDFFIRGETTTTTLESRTFAAAAPEAAAAAARPPGRAVRRGGWRRRWGGRREPPTAIRPGAPSARSASAKARGQAVMSWVTIEHEGKAQRIAVARTRDGVWVGWPGGAAFVAADRKTRSTGGTGPAGPLDDEIRAPMTGKVVAVRVAPGAAVGTGDVVVVLEAMKMEYRLLSPRDGTVEDVRCREGELVDLGKTLVTLAGA
jgi:3-methylcrotonyl-CoA carboxylase alpha subunit